VVTAPNKALIREKIINNLPMMGVKMSPEFKAALLPHPKEKQVIGGVQAGKSMLGFCELQIAVMEWLLAGDPDDEKLYWVIVPSYRDPHKEMDYLLKYNQESGIISSKNFPQDASVNIQFFGGKVKVETRTATDPEAIAGEPCDGVLVVEAGQMPGVIRERALERTLTRNGWIVYSGTLENDAAKPQYVWYGQLGREWLDNPTPDGMAFSLPTWANLAIHPEGRNSPGIVAEEKRWLEAGKAFTFNRRIAGIPDGVQYPVYDDVQVGDWGAGDVREWQFIRSRNAGGHDWGTTDHHPSTLVPVQVSANNIVVVRDYWDGLGAPITEIESRRHLMSQRWNIPKSRWGFDPMLKQSAQLLGVQAVATGKGARQRRVGLVETRLKERRILFDMDVLEGDTPDECQRKERVRRLFHQMQRVHYIKKEIPGEGEVFVYNRSDDDGAAALEDAIEVIDSKKSNNFSAWKSYS
jgi:hypothetical protein